MSYSVLNFNCRGVGSFSDIWILRDQYLNFGVVFPEENGGNGKRNIFVLTNLIIINHFRLPISPIGTF